MQFDPLDDATVKVEGGCWDSSMEDVRLVIWDLDDVFWAGTLTEGGISYRDENHQLVVDLARRGIISSICSKNDRASVQAILEQRGVWDYFVFPSIDWTSKAPRIAEIVARAQLRPASVMFIDDNPLNRAEALDLLPDLQVSDETAVHKFRNDARFKGKDDQSLTRLQQYKVLETRATDMQAAASDNVTFLRKSEIKVRFDFDVVENIDRAIELINRTNQLNFTKRRLPEDVVEARRVLGERLSDFWTFAGLVNVRDRYGDYGAVGFFAFRSDFEHLEHYCFSCRTLGIGVEKWVYEYLGKPHLDVVGSVVTDLNDGPAVDWIELADDNFKDVSSRREIAHHLRLHGGCDLDALSHYARMLDRNCVVETNFEWRALWHYRNSVRHLGLSLSEDAVARQLIERAGLNVLFKTDVFATSDKPLAVILSFWADGFLGGWRHRDTGIAIALASDELNIEELYKALVGNPRADLSATFEAARIDAGSWAFLERLFRLLASEFEPTGRIEEDEFKRFLNMILANASASVQVVLLLGPAQARSKEHGLMTVEHACKVREWSVDVASNYQHVHLIDVQELILDGSEIVQADHIDRRVYFRVFQRLEELLARL